MTREETIAVLAVLKAAYPQFYRGLGRNELDGIISLWADLFAQEDFSLVQAAVKGHIAADAKGYPPHIGAVKEAVRKLSHPQELAELQAWGLVVKALKNSGYNSAQEFEKLPEEIRRVVGSHSQLKEWALMDAETLQSVVASNFQRSYKAIAAGRREKAVIPAAVLELGRLLEKRARTEAREDAEANLLLNG